MIALKQDGVRAVAIYPHHCPNKTGRLSAQAGFQPVRMGHQFARRRISPSCATVATSVPLRSNT